MEGIEEVESREGCDAGMGLRQGGEGHKEGVEGKNVEMTSGGV